jgi:hypothetical protein
MDFGVLAPGHTGNQQCQVHAPSDADVVATITQGDSRVFQVRRIDVYDLMRELIEPPREPPVHKRPARVVEPDEEAGGPTVTVPYFRAASDGQVPLAVKRGQLIAVDVDAQPAAELEGQVEALLEIRGTGWDVGSSRLRVTVE